LPLSPQLCQNGDLSIGETESSCRGPSQTTMVGVERQSCRFLVKNFPVKKEVWDCALSWCNRQFFVAKVQGEVFAHFHAIIIKRHRIMRNWLFGLPGWIIWEQCLLYQRKWWTCSRPCS
jgi:hypothetical protein